MSATTDGDDKVNMVPLIDTMFFLILFFLLVTKFTPEEKSIASLLPTNKGTGKTQGPVPIIPERIVIAVYPAGIAEGLDAATCERELAARERDGTLGATAMVRVGGSAPIAVAGGVLSQPVTGSPALSAAMGEVHAYIDAELARRDTLAPNRADLAPVVIACYSGLDWKYALLAYDAVRGHESKAAGSTPADLLAAREVSFAPPRLRNHAPNELGRELSEVLNFR